MRKLFLVLSLCAVASYAVAIYAQQSPPPDLSSGLVAQAAYKGWIEGQFSALWAAVGAIPALQTATANIPQDEANITLLQQQHSADAAAIATLQAQQAILIQQVAALQQVPAPLAAVYALGISKSADRSSPVNLNGATIGGNVYIYSVQLAALGNDNPAGVISVSYWLDNVNMTGTAFHVEGQQPWDFAGGTPALAVAWSTASVTNGLHTITQKVTFTSGAEVDTATFTVFN